MEALLKELAGRCYRHGLKFEYIPASTGIVVSDENCKIVSSTWLDLEGKKGIEKVTIAVNQFIGEEAKYEKYQTA